MCPALQGSSQDTRSTLPWGSQIPVDESVTIPDVEPFDSAQDLDGCQADVGEGGKKMGEK